MPIVHVSKTHQYNWHSDKQKCNFINSYYMNCRIVKSNATPYICISSKCVSHKQLICVFGSFIQSDNTAFQQDLSFFSADCIYDKVESSSWHVFYLSHPFSISLLFYSCLLLVPFISRLTCLLSEVSWLLPSSRSCALGAGWRWERAGGEQSPSAVSSLCV